jgi:uncharacterized membrane protein YecN with MAPEG domain
MERAMFVTPLYAGLLALWFLVLSWRVVARRRSGIYLGDGGDQALLRVIRGHANFAEYVPFALLLMAMLEASRFSIYVLHALGIALLAGRLLHGYALSFTEKFPPGRVWGATLTFIVLGIEAVLCVYQGILGQWIWCCAR